MVYGDTAGQIGQLKGGTVDGVVTSPPYESSLRNQKDGIDWEKAKQNGEGGEGHSKGQSCHATYGDSKGQIGASQGQTYWEAVAQVYAAAHRALRPGGIIALVVKDYVKDKHRVPLCEDTARLLTHLGFTVIERVHAMLTKETKHGDLFQGETTSTKSRKSFFRRLAEKKGSPPIDFEEVIIAQKPL